MIVFNISKSEYDPYLCASENWISYLLRWRYRITWIKLYWINQNGRWHSYLNRNGYTTTMPLGLRSLIWVAHSFTMTNNYFLLIFSILDTFKCPQILIKLKQRIVTCFLISINRIKVGIAAAVNTLTFINLFRAKNH